MRVVGRGVEPVTGIAYRRARSGGGTETVRLVVERLAVESVPAGCDAVLVTGDLQGMAPSPLGGPSVLLGVALADYLPVWAEQGLLPPPHRLLVVLAGDLYSAARADERGASGAVAEVWWAMAAAGCRMTVGVAGNHDAITTGELAELGPAATLLDGTCVDVGGTRIAGVGGIIGDPHRFGRRSEADQLTRLGAALATGPDVLVLHEGPAGQDDDQPGHPTISAALHPRAPTLTVCGHVHWDSPVSRLGTGNVVNVDGRAVVLTTFIDR
ncbi:metallophosphoesterase family protein [Virgisporangium aurantiacum]|uniref:metallophosphoesterase family protein n=1 Tax=Virgisporangium aurantiacum TaxID=175570 RepID=UPI00194E7CE8|nr:metallophosphoesterase [Virgisporangium aurantiacum]